MNGKVPAIVLGFNGTALGIIRELGRRGIPVIAVDSSKSVSYFSKYCEHFLSPDMERMPEAFLELLIKLSRKFVNPVLFPSNDNGVLFIAKYFREIEPYFRMTFQNPDLVVRIMRKDSLYELATKYFIPVPKTINLDSWGDLSSVKSELQYPLILKPVISFEFERIVGKKVIKINSEEELKRIYESLHDRFRMLVQEIVPGPDEEQYSCAFYMDNQHRPLGVFNARKIRSHPIEFGVGTLVESIAQDSFTSVAIKFLRNVGYIGIAEVEFKKSRVTGQHQMIEVNTRSWAQNLLAERCGNPISYIAYRDLVGRPIKTVSPYRIGIKWISAERDLLACSEYKEKGLMNVYRYIKSLYGVRVFNTFALDDPVPFVYYLFFMRYIRISTVLKKIYSIISTRILKAHLF